jgi:hypothetical protein
MAAISRKRGARYGAVLVICLVLLGALVGPITIPTAAAQGQKQSQQHKIVIIHVSGSPSWSITASGSIQLDPKTTENTDSISGKTADGSVGGLPWENTSDPRDVIYYTGEVLQFDLGGTGNARVKLDGKRVDPKSLKNTPTSTPTPPSTSTHKLLIRSAGKGTNYTVQVSGTIGSGPREKSDTVYKRKVNGHVGSNDTVDAITYTGHITSFTASSGDLKATLDGTFLLNASILDANHLRLVTQSNSSTSQRSVRYRVTVTGTIASGEGVEERDSPTNTTTVSGWLLPGDSDGFYFTGEIVSSSSSVSDRASVYVNGKSRSLVSSPTPTPTSTPSPIPTTTSPQQETNSPSLPPTTASPADDSSLSKVMIGGAIGLGIIVLAAMLLLYH